MNISHIGDASDAIAFRAYYTFITPAVQAVTRRALQSVFHPETRCDTGHSGRGDQLCADCSEVIDDLVLDTYTRLRHAIAGRIARTSTGEPVGELARVAEHVRSADAADEDVTVMAARLARLALSDPHAGPAWLRAAKAQLVHYPARHLAAALRRDIALAHGGAARPDRDLTTAAWATPLRESAAGLELLIAFVYRLRHTTPNPYRMPEDIRARHRLTDAEAYTLLATTLEQLRALRPAFFDANIAAPLALSDQISLDDVGTAAETAPDCAPEHRLLAGEDTGHARAVIRRLVSSRPGEDAEWSRRRYAYRQILLAVTTVADGSSGDLVTRCVHRLGLSEVSAKRLLHRLARLVAEADGDWVAQAIAIHPV